MSPITVSKLVSPPDEVIERAATVLHQAFGEEDFFSLSMIGGNVSLVHDLMLTHVKAGLVGGEVLVAKVDGKDEIDGVAIFFGPGEEIFGTEEQRTGTGWYDLFNKFDDETKKWWLESFLPTYGKQADMAHGPGKKLDSWHCLYIGVVPAVQGKGLGTALMKHVNEIADRDGKYVTVETVESIPFYENVGFEVKLKDKFTSRYGEWPYYFLGRAPVAAKSV